MYSKFHSLLITLLTIIFFTNNIQAQDQPEHKLIKIVKINEPVTVDGLDDEKAWQTADRTDQFINKWPLDTGAAMHQTEVRLMYDDKYLYVFARLYVTSDQLVIQSLKRDVNPYYSEGFSIVLDPSNQKSSGVTFGVNASGAQFDGIVQLNSDSFEMDAKWYSATKRSKDYWTAEMAIPFKSIRFPANATEWGINFIRNDMLNNCFSTWNRVPVAYFGANLSFLGKGVFEQSPAKPGSNNAFIPYINTNTSKNISGTSHFNAGLDAKLAINSSLNLDVTVNPDFSQVDVDQQVINIDRYDISFPEKRLFFLENSDLYSSLGSTTIRPFFSRKIGLTSDGRGVSLLGGVRLNGYLDPKTRIEIMDVQSGKQQNSYYQNYSTLVFERQILKRSNIRGYLTDVESTGGQSFKNLSTGKYNRVAGAEFNYVADKGNYDFGAKLSQSYDPSRFNDNVFGNLYADYFSPALVISSQFNRIGKNYIAALGFTPRLYNFDAANDTTIRKGYYENTTHFAYSIYPKNKSVINVHSLEANTSVFLNEDGSSNEIDLNTKYSIFFADRRFLYVGWTNKSIDLPFETLIFTGLNKFKPVKYSFNYFTLDYESNFLKPFSWSINAEGGGYFNGTRLSLTGGIKQRIQPWANFGVDFNYNQIRVDGKRVDPLIIDPTFEIDFNKGLYWTTFAQYNTNIHNFNINNRLQWRFKPLSDIYLVYASNYGTPQFTSTNYSLTLKVVYWIN